MPLFVAANWKMHKTAAEARAFLKDFLALWKPGGVQLLVAPPFTALKESFDAAGSQIWVGAQNMHDELQGAFTGEISAQMLKEAGAKFVIIGHSERRRLFHETNREVNRKMRRALQEGLIPLLCVGESEEERAGGMMETVLTQQLKEALQDLPLKGQLLVAYEPVWAIGTGKRATVHEIARVHRFLREQLVHLCKGTAPALLYGGSVSAENAAELAAEKEIEGVLVGGASLEVSSFLKIVESFQTKKE
jgi:triosephosphate isomerase (TIM)